MIPIEMLPFIIASTMLFILSWIDIKTYNYKKGYIPSVLTTLFLIVMMALSSYSFEAPLFAVLLSWLFLDLKFFEGMADIKSFVATSFTLGSLPTVVIFSSMVVLIGAMYKLIAKIRKGKQDVPFIPVIFISYMIFIIVGVLL
jgi:prepilin signal peptidase PulO-like enzyme (type II secretory pathway)